MDNLILTKVLEDPKLAEMLRNEDFYSIYSHLIFSERGQFTQECVRAGVNPLDYMDTIPAYYISSPDCDTFTIPSHISRIDAYALSYLPFRKICYQGTVEEFNGVDKQPHWLPASIFEVACNDGVWYLIPKNATCGATNSGTTTISGIAPKITVKTGGFPVEVANPEPGELFYNPDAGACLVYTGSHWIALSDVSITMDQTALDDCGLCANSTLTYYQAKISS